MGVRYHAYANKIGIRTYPMYANCQTLQEVCLERTYS